MIKDFKYLPMPEDGCVLQLGDTYPYKMDTIEKGAKSNFNNFISILNSKERHRPFQIDNYINKLAGICNQYGVSKDRTRELILNRFCSDYRMKNEYPDSSVFEEFVQSCVESIYGKFASIHNSWHKKEDDTEDTPILPKEVYADLPPMLKGLVHYFEPGRERDVFFLSVLGVLSSCFPDVRGNYANQLVGMNLFLFISAPASAGKGVMIWARRLAEEIHKDCERKYRQAMADYSQELKAYKEDGGAEAGKPVPVKPERQLFFIPANSSASKVIQTLMANKNFGVILDTEADTLSQALGNDWGNFSDTLRKAFHHEPIELQRKLNDEYVSIEESFLSVVLSGTPNQIKNLLSNVENGFFSRFLFYDFPLTLEWKNVFDRTKESPDGVFKSESDQLLGYTKKISELASERGGNILFTFSPEQEQAFHEMFAEKQEKLHHIYGDQIIASLRRLALITFRIAMLLTVMRHIKMDIPAQLSCSDADFKTAISITETLLSHTTKIYNQLQQLRKSKTAGGRKELYYEKLPDAFQRTGAMEVAALMNIKEKTAENYLSGLIYSGKLERVEHNHYQKIN